MSEPKELWEVARDAGTSSFMKISCDKEYWTDVANAIIEHEHRKADPYAHLKAAAADPTKQIRMPNLFGDGRHGNWQNSSYHWKFNNRPEHYEIRDKPKKVDWSQLSEHVKKYWNVQKVHGCTIPNSAFPSIWIPWGLPEFGDTCPVPEGVMVEVVFRGSIEADEIEPATNFRWGMEGTSRSGDIIAFRITGLCEGYES